MNPKNSRLKIGLVDSGIGGLTVVKEILKSSLDCDCVYLADTQNFPYGNQKKQSIIQNSYRNLHFLTEQNVDLIITACHTISAIAFPFLKNYSSIPLLSVIPLSIESVLQTTQTKIVGIMGTSATIFSLAYNQFFWQHRPDIKLFSKPFSSLATVIEKKSIDSSFLYDTISDYFDSFFLEGMDSIILGCTHFSMLKPFIHNILGESVSLIDPAMSVVDRIKKFYPACHFNKNTAHSCGNLTIFVTRFFKSFEKKSQFFLKTHDHNITIKEVSLQAL